MTASRGVVGEVRLLWGSYDRVLTFMVDSRPAAPGMMSRTSVSFSWTGQPFFLRPFRNSCEVLVLPSSPADARGADAALLHGINLDPTILL